MLDRNEPVVQFKLEMLDRVLSQSDSAVVFGDIWRVDGGYTVEAARHCERVTLIDSLETRSTPKPPTTSCSTSARSTIRTGSGQ